MHTQPRMYKRAILCNTLQSYLSKNSYTNTNQMSLNNPSSRLLLLDVLALLLIACILPIPVRSQSYAVQFPTSTASCVTCMPAFATAPCQTILNSIGQSSNGSISTSILAECQCTGTFLTLYSSCVQCFM
ncbi:hypothetical protein BC939DRAFT_446226 [Gamsiella multidivaricata]|uniref:uncharacterized protein n=1 Tax=Gamsiella multidivaricata TaxID=101098 RepID=UPI0022205B71|nr:uncharacterized protein BC939DRAFT_446226 [Gamsiella multidivaricata]KAI7826923.1 hypothetical protein BC939DRAFT_446226 [Gamsiella multidivaricata]